MALSAIDRSHGDGGLGAALALGNVPLLTDQPARFALVCFHGEQGSGPPAQEGTTGKPTPQVRPRENDASLPTPSAPCST